MFASRVNRYIIREILSPTLICLLVFTMVLLMGRMMKLVDLVVNKGVSVSDILILFGTMLPTFLNITLPLAFLMGIMIGLSRMSADSETVALKAAGIGLAQIARPVIALALVFSILAGAAGIWLKPWGYSAFRNQIFAITMQKASIGLQKQVFMKQFDNLVLYANDIDDKSGLMQGLFIVEKKPETSMLIFASQGSIMANDEDESISVRLHDGTIHRQQKDKDSAYQLIHFKNYSVQPEIETDGNKAAAGKQRLVKTKEIQTKKLWNHINGLEEGMQKERLAKYNSELHSRLVSPLAPLIFALFALPFSIQSHRSGRSGGFVVGLVVYLCYYLLLSLAQTFTADAGLAPWLTFWLPHTLMILAGLYCLRQSAQEQPNIIVTWLEQLFVVVAARMKKIDEYS
jgi:lipopolysaccharide export system permease protein